jgi:glycogenin glucosyltransferase
LIDIEQSVRSTPEGASTIVQYHTKGEFQPVAPAITITPTHQPEERDSEIFHPSAEQPLHETIEIPEEVEEAYVPPAQTNLEAESQPEPLPEPEYHPEPEITYAPWDASRLVVQRIR